MEEQQKFYTPAEAARRLGVPVYVLRYMREQGKIEGTRVGTMTLYTEEQIRNADMRPRKSGPKPRDSRDEPSPAAVA